MIISEHLMEVHQITQIKDGCIFKTKKISELWVLDGASSEEQVVIAKAAGGDFLVTPNQHQPYHKLYRSRVQ